MDLSKLSPLQRTFAYICFIVLSIAGVVYIYTDEDLRAEAPNFAATILLIINALLLEACAYRMKKKKPEASIMQIRFKAGLIACALMSPLWLIAYFKGWLAI